MRFAHNPFANPFGGSGLDKTATGSIPQKPSAQVASTPAPARVATAPLPPPTTPGLSQNTINRPGAGSNAAVTGFNANGWTTAGGSTVVLSQGESINALSNRYGVPAEAIYKTNGIAVGSTVPAGTKIIIPVYRPNAASAATPASAKPTATSGSAAKPAAVKPAGKVASGPATPQPPAKPEKAPEKVIGAKADTAKPKMVKGKPLPGGDNDAAKAKPSKAPEPKAAEVKQPQPAPAETKVAKVEKPEPQTTGAIPSSAPEFRWPARGRVISGFRNNGNDGINIAVPEGTPVKAADEGTVAYAGSELKGYGNLVLVRHSNGYVSAYAHNGELKVKKGDPVKRGQTIATSGQSGNVSSPQLHFEIRKGATPVDPSGYLQ
ncbi:MAG: peptidoglycan DD-metalloendopeptidase family protein [Beijerinckiaceae bacterium]